MRAYVCVFFLIWWCVVNINNKQNKNSIVSTTTSTQKNKNTEIVYVFRERAKKTLFIKIR